MELIYSFAINAFALRSNDVKKMRKTLERYYYYGSILLAEHVFQKYHLIDYETLTNNHRC